MISIIQIKCLKFLKNTVEPVKWVLTKTHKFRHLPGIALHKTLFILHVMK